MNPVIESPKCSIKRNVFIGIILAVVIVLIAAIFAAIPPNNFPGRVIISIKDGSSLSQVAKILADNHIIRSQFLYKTFVVITGERTRVISGDYLFSQPQSVIRVAYRTAYGVQGLSKIKVTIPEGTNTKAMATILKKSIPAFDDIDFIASSSQYEGYLFPDTYFFLENVKPNEVISIMRSNFDKHISPLSDKIKSFDKPLADIVTMASIVEKEATST